MIFTANIELATNSQNKIRNNLAQAGPDNIDATAQGTAFAAAKPDYRGNQFPYNKGTPIQ